MRKAILCWQLLGAKHILWHYCLFGRQSRTVLKNFSDDYNAFSKYFKVAYTFQHTKIDHNINIDGHEHVTFSNYCWIYTKNAMNANKRSRIAGSTGQWKSIVISLPFRMHLMWHSPSPSNTNTHTPTHTKHFDNQLKRMPFFQASIHFISIQTCVSSDRQVCWPLFHCQPASYNRLFPCAARQTYTMHMAHNHVWEKKMTTLFSCGKYWLYRNNLHV